MPLRVLLQGVLLAAAASSRGVYGRWGRSGKRRSLSTQRLVQKRRGPQAHKQTTDCGQRHRQELGQLQGQGGGWGWGCGGMARAPSGTTGPRVAQALRTWGPLQGREAAASRCTQGPMQRLNLRRKQQHPVLHLAPYPVWCPMMTPVLYPAAHPAVYPVMYPVVCPAGYRTESPQGAGTPPRPLLGCRRQAQRRQLRPRAPLPLPLLWPWDSRAPAAGRAQPQPRRRRATRNSPQALQPARAPALP